jgi:hypothetical protein
MTISLGNCGPTDCCLILTTDYGERYQFGVESPTWEFLGEFYPPGLTPVVVEVGSPLHQQIVERVFAEYNDSCRRLYHWVLDDMIPIREGEL